MTVTCCRQVTEVFASDQKLELALEENARVFRTLERRRERPPQPPPRPAGRPGVGSQLPPLPPKPTVVTRTAQQVSGRCARLHRWVSWGRTSRIGAGAGMGPDLAHFSAMVYGEDVRLEANSTCVIPHSCNGSSGDSVDPV